MHCLRHFARCWRYFALLVEVLRTLLARLCALVEALRTLYKAFYLKEMELLSRPFGKGTFSLKEMKQCTFSLKEMNIPVLEVLCHFLRLVCRGTLHFLQVLGQARTRIPPRPPHSARHAQTLNSLKKTLFLRRQTIEILRFSKRRRHGGGKRGGP